MGGFSTQFVPLISNSAPKIMQEQYNQLFLLTTKDHKWFKVVGIKISFEHVDFWAKTLLLRTHHL